MIHQPVRCLPAPIGNSGFFLKQIVKNFFADNHCIWDYIVFIRKENIYAISKCLAWFPFINELKDYDFEFRQGAGEQEMRELASIFCTSGPDILYGIHRKILMMEVFLLKECILFLKKREYYDVVHNKL